MDRGKCKDPRATLILCAFAPVSGSAPVLVSAFGASADTSRRQEMQIGDLVKCHDQIGLLIKQLPGTPAYWIVQWSNGVLDTVNPYLLEVINANR